MSVADNIRLLTSIAERHDWPTTHSGAIAKTYASDDERWQSWAVETLLWAYQRANLVDKALAAFQAIEYAARASNLPHPAMHDMIAELKNEVTGALRVSGL